MKMIHTSYCHHSYWHGIKLISTDTNYKLYAIIIIIKKKTLLMMS